MKKNLSLLFGCFAALIVSLSFSACNPKDQNNASDYSLVGVWKWVYEEYDYSYTLTINKNNTGDVIVMQYELEEVGQCTFAWKYTSENTINLVIESGHLPGVGGQGEKIDLEFEFFGPDKVLFTMVDDPEESFGTFTRVSGGNGGTEPPAALSDIEQRLVGNWVWTYVQYGLVNTLIINADHTGKVITANLLQQNSQATFNWSVVGDDIVRLNVTSGQLIGLGDIPNPLVLKVSFPANNQVLFTMVDDPDEVFGPFVKQ